MTAKQLKALYLKQSVALALTARKIADMHPTGKFSSLDVYNFSGSAPVVIQLFATCPGTDLSGSASQRDI
ncbi:MAG: hypothetical protein SOW92_00460 [Kiritimatiellia bacterium]|nr:hypothetical protein [Kiritimatiellia bacterium]